MRFTIGRANIDAILALGALWLAPSLAAQQGEVTGRVTDKASGNAVAGAQVSIVGTTIRALTAQDGRYRVVNVPAGAVTVRVATIGYGTVTQGATVPAGGSAEVNVAITAVPIGLDAIVVTATGD